MILQEIKNSEVCGLMLQEVHLLNLLFDLGINYLVQITSRADCSNRCHSIICPKPY